MRGTMFALQRQQKILELLYANKSVDVGVLSKLFNVSEMTVRRDLGKLEEQGLVIKSYGGAILREEASEEPADNAPDEPGMVKLAVALIEDGDSVFLGSGPCSEGIAKALCGRSLIVVTNDIMAAATLSGAANVRTFVVGSELRPMTNMLIGDFNERMLASLTIAKGFIFVDGVDMSAGFTLSSFEECKLISNILPVTHKLVIMARERTFARPSFARLANLETPQAVITDADIPAEYKRFFFDHGISLYTPFDFK